jgi:hypothetical protein
MGREYRIQLSNVMHRINLTHCPLSTFIISGVEPHQLTVALAASMDVIER